MQWLRLSLVLLTSFLFFSLLLPKNSYSTLSAAGNKKAPQTIVIAATSDLHGWVSTQSVFPDSKPKGIAYIAPIIRELRQKYPNLFLVDAGDTLQGSPLTAWLHTKFPPIPHPIIKLMNQLQYDVVAIGNHDFDIPSPVLQQALMESQFPWLLSNAKLSKNSLAIKSFHILEQSSIKIGVLGMLTPGTSLWVYPEHLQGIELKDIARSTQEWVSILKTKYHVDIVIILMHSGHNTEYDRASALLKGVPIPNAATMVADSVKGIDLIISGHAHHTYPKREHTELLKSPVPIVSPGYWGNGVSLIQLNMEYLSERWRVKSKKFQFFKASSTPDPLILSSISKPLEIVEKDLQQRLNIIIKKLPTKHEFYHCTNLLSEAAIRNLLGPGATLLSPWKWKPKDFPKTGSHLTKHHLYHWLPYDNTLVQARLYGRQILKLLQPYQQFRQEERFSRKHLLLPGNLKIEELQEEESILVWMSHYHWNGGQGLLPRVLAQSSQLRKKHTELFRELILQYLQHGELSLPSRCGFLEVQPSPISKTSLK